MLLDDPAPLSRRDLNVMRFVSLLDALALLAIGYFAAVGEEYALAALAPTHGVLFLILVVSLLWAAERGRLAPQLLIGVCLLGPLVSIPGLEAVRARQRRAAQEGRLAG